MIQWRWSTCLFTTIVKHLCLEYAGNCICPSTSNNFSSKFYVQSSPKSWVLNTTILWGNNYQPWHQCSQVSPGYVELSSCWSVSEANLRVAGILQPVEHCWLHHPEPEAFATLGAHWKLAPIVMGGRGLLDTLCQGAYECAQIIVEENMGCGGLGLQDCNRSLFACLQSIPCPAVEVLESRMSNPLPAPHPTTQL